MQKFEQKGKAAAEAAALPVMEESKMETTILYLNKMKPPGTNPAAQTTSANTNTILLPYVYRYVPNYTPGNEKAAQIARPSPETPSALQAHHSRKEDANHYRQSAYTVNKKAAGAPYSPTACKPRRNRRSG